MKTQDKLSAKKIGADHLGRPIYNIHINGELNNSIIIRKIRNNYVLFHNKKDVNGFYIPIKRESDPTGEWRARTIKDALVNLRCVPNAQLNQ